MSSNLEWFLSDGTLLSGAEAETFLTSILYEYADQFDHISFVLNDCLDHCAVSQETTCQIPLCFQTKGSVLFRFSWNSCWKKSH